MFIPILSQPIIPSQTTMEKTLFKRRDLVKSFPTSFSFSALKDHFSCEYLSVVGCHVDEKCLKYLVELFMLMWKAIKNREKVFSTPRGNAWLEKKCPFLTKNEIVSKKQSHYCGHLHSI